MVEHTSHKRSTRVRFSLQALHFAKASSSEPIPAQVSSKPGRGLYCVGMKYDTKLVRGDFDADRETGAILPPIHQVATYVLEELGKDKGYDYSRAVNPTRTVLEKHLALSEGGKHAVAFASGMAAVDAVMKLLKSGDHVVVSDDVYGGVQRLFTEVLSAFGLTFTFVDTSDAEAVRGAVTEKTKMLWIETPTNPLLKITDIEEMASIAKENDLTLVVDSTFATPVFLRPLELKADIVVQSTTKYLSGHNQLIGGAAITSDEKIAEKLAFIQKAVGAVPGPWDCWLTILGLKTLHIRMQRHSENAQRVAEFLEQHEKVATVAYPGLASHPQHELAKRQMSGFSGVVSFTLTGGIESATHVMNTLKLFRLAESLGAVESMVTHPATMTHATVPKEEREARGFSDGLIRLSVGIEDVNDLIDDLKQALAGA